MKIGERIKTLRKKNDLTQEKLADYLCVSYQAVSKWETGLSSPDLSLIAPLTRLFHVSADELLGLSTEKTDERKAYFDAEYHEFWKKEDKKADYQTALQAVAEYPGEFQYLEWLATSEYYAAFCDDEYQSGGSPDSFHALLESSVKHYLMILEDCEDEKLRKKALYGLVLAYKYLGRTEDSRKYAQMYPESDGVGRDEVLAMCLGGEELLAHRQKMLRNALGELCMALYNLYAFQRGDDPHARAAMDAEERVIHAVIDDGNFQEWNASLYEIEMKRAEMAVACGCYEEAIEKLALAKRYALAYDDVCRNRKGKYTCCLLDHYTYDYTGARLYAPYMEDLREWVSERKVFAPLRDREDLKALLEE